MRFMSLVYLALVALALFFLYRVISSLKDGATSVGDAVKDAFSFVGDAAKTAGDYVTSPLTNPAAQTVGDTLSNPLSRAYGRFMSFLFPSAAESEVNAIYGKTSGGRNKQDVRKPITGIGTSLQMNPYDGQSGLGVDTNPSPGPNTTVGTVKKPAINRGGLSRANGNVYYTGNQNPSPPVNNPVFKPAYDPVADNTVDMGP